jgi:hypothetical protein
MDRVRFGRALGYGVRHAAKSLAQAADAATTPNPSRPAGAPRQPVRAASVVSNLVEAHQTVHHAKQQMKSQVTSGLKTHGRALGKSAWAPVAKFSSVIWLQVTGTFFALLALFLFTPLWKLRGAVHSPHSPEAHRLYLHAAAFAVFAYFAISNFVRASRREKR